MPDYSWNAVPYNTHSALCWLVNEYWLVQWEWFNHWDRNLWWADTRICFAMVWAVFSLESWPRILDVYSLQRQFWTFLAYFTDEKCPFER